ncbi:MAG: L-2-amino-thiazoline-4-carboxylic acid hydrolase [Desulfobacterales bacterium]|nr:L-2-amino-thiazoline-4-carboxylic acid hydrolase [Desulfobacterales bacterium]
MSRIKNISKRNNFVIKAVRGTLEHRATWLYLLVKEAEKKGIGWEEIGYPAIRACGHIHGENLVDLSSTSSLKGLKKKLFTLPAQMVFDMKILEVTDNKLSIDFGYCPLVAAWQKLGCTDKEIERLCDIAMEGDRGIAESFGGKLELGGTIAHGDEKCQIRFMK